MLKHVRKRYKDKQIRNFCDGWTDGWTDGPTNRPTNRPRCRVACTRLKTEGRQRLQMTSNAITCKETRPTPISRVRDIKN